MHVDLPVPPPFMWACPRCAELLDDLTVAFTLSTRHALYEGAVRCQLMLASHLATEHPDDIPAPHADDCLHCVFYREHTDGDGMDVLWAEHRARDLFLPESVARHI